MKKRREEKKWRKKKKKNNNGMETICVRMAMDLYGNYWCMDHYGFVWKLVCPISRV